METQNRNSLRREVCIFDVHRSSVVKDITVKEHWEVETKDVPCNFFTEFADSNIPKAKIFRPKI